MPVHPTTKNGRPAYQWGTSGAKYTYTAGNAASREFGVRPKMVTTDEILKQVKDSLHQIADEHDWKNHHSFGPENHLGLNNPDEAYWIGFNEGCMSVAHDLLVRICTANAVMR